MGSAHVPRVVASTARDVFRSGVDVTLFLSPLLRKGTSTPARFSGVDRDQAGPNIVAMKSKGLLISLSRLTPASDSARSHSAPDWVAAALAISASPTVPSAAHSCRTLSASMTL